MLNQPGTYVVVLKCEQRRQVEIGRRLKLVLQPGYYLYVGSAFGPGGLASRIKHHTSVVKRPHWHLDYLRLYTHVLEVWYSYDKSKRECSWAKLMSSIGEVYNPIKGFGASDCTCSSHLMYSSMRPEFEQFKQLVMNRLSGHQAIEFITIMESGEDGNR